MSEISRRHIGFKHIYKPGDLVVIDALSRQEWAIVTGTYFNGDVETWNGYNVFGAKIGHVKAAAHRVKSAEEYSTSLAKRSTQQPI